MNESFLGKVARTIVVELRNGDGRTRGTRLLQPQTAILKVRNCLLSFLFFHESAATASPNETDRMCAMHKSVRPKHMGAADGMMGECSSWDEARMGVRA